MTSILLSVNGAQAWASTTGPLTSGMVGIPVIMEYDEAWNGLRKNLVCRCSPWGSDSGDSRAILNVETTSVVAHEVMKAGMYLWLGVEGFRDDGTLVIPTTWAMCGKIQHGANTAEDPSADPELSVWNQLQAEIQQIKQDAASGTVQNGGQVADHSRHVRAIAHRGYSAEAPENTIPAYKIALKMGADMVEADIVSSKDGVLFSFHDHHEPDVLRRPELIMELTSEEIEAIHPSNCITLYSRYKINRLTEILDFLPEGVLLNIDRAWDILPQVLKVLDQYPKALSQVVIKAPLRAEMERQLTGKADAPLSPEITLSSAPAGLPRIRIPFAAA